jgi:hypothetical protein
MKEKIINLIKSLAKSGITLVIHIILGIVCIQQCRISQAGILPTCVSTKPYTDVDVEVEQVHMDFLTTSDKGVNKSIKATFPIKENLAIYQESSLLMLIRNWTIGSQSTNLTHYLGSCMASSAATYYAMHTNMYGFVNSWFPQWLIMGMSFTILPLIFMVAGICAVISFVFTAITSWSLLFELGIINEDNPTRKYWRPDVGMWTWPSSPFTLLIFCGVLFAFPMLCYGGIIMAIIMGLSVLVTKPQLLYSKKDQIEQVFSSIVKDENNTTDPESPENGDALENSDDEEDKYMMEAKDAAADLLAQGGDEKDATAILIQAQKARTQRDIANNPSTLNSIHPANTTQVGGGDGDADEKEANEKAEEACLTSNKTTSNKKERFTLMNQIKLTFKVYRHIIMIIMTGYMLKDIYSTMGTQWLLSGIFAVIAMSYFTKVYHKYKISACDNFTDDLIGYQNSYRQCELRPGEPIREAPARRAGFKPTWDGFVAMFSRPFAPPYPTPLALSVGTASGSSSGSGSGSGMFGMGNAAGAADEAGEEAAGAVEGAAGAVEEGAEGAAAGAEEGAEAL